MEIKIRLAARSDAGAISTVICRSIAELCAEDHQDDPALIAAWLRNKTPENIASWLSSPKYLCVAAMQADSLAGFAMAEGDQILLCYVLPDFLHLGVGRALLDAMERQVISRGVAQLRLESTRTALAFYRRNGFSLAGPAITAFGMEAQPMSKRLPTAMP